MEPSTGSPGVFDLAHASDDQYAALHRYTTRLRLEMLPDDPPTPLASAIRSWRSAPPLATRTVWLDWNDGATEVVARGQLVLPATTENRHLGEFTIDVHPDARRRGHARRLLRAIATHARAAERRTLVTTTIGRVPAGAAFLTRIGAEAGLETQSQQLVIAACSPELIARWQAGGRERNPGLELGCWEGAIPDEDLAAAVELQQVMNTAPRGTLQIDDQKMTPAEMRQLEASLRSVGARRWILWLRDTASGTLVGYTTVIQLPNLPHVLQTAHTAVRPEYRNRGLARWLKAAIFERLAREVPEARFLRTANADVNAAMLAVNREMGYTPYDSRTIWQVSVDALETYASSTAGTSAPRE